MAKALDVEVGVLGLCLRVYCTPRRCCYVLDVLVHLVASACPGRVREIRAARPFVCELNVDVHV